LGVPPSVVIFEPLTGAATPSISAADWGSISLFFLRRAEHVFLVPITRSSFCSCSFRGELFLLLQGFPIFVPLSSSIVILFPGSHTPRWPTLSRASCSRPIFFRVWGFPFFLLFFSCWYFILGVFSALPSENRHLTLCCHFPPAHSFAIFWPDSPFCRVEEFYLVFFFLPPFPSVLTGQLNAATIHPAALPSTDPLLFADRSPGLVRSGVDDHSSPPLFGRP